MNAWQRFWRRHTRRLTLRLRRQFRFRLAASRRFRPRPEPLEPRVVLAAPVAVGDSYTTPGDKQLVGGAPLFSVHASSRGSALCTYLIILEAVGPRQAAGSGFARGRV